ncbi:hypothetical protein EJ05DRAFT_508400 [Pseudovirgaria hyperparasitica]|uniref:Large ribosomal subunit protein mL50 n=1 Tax=Pseudovirgaria hyperparasitica TaxID=470096 RepID=A0A6A6WGL1_9PEZI|nr:uncharacterized protein EJ05DRAFT_508400 [Pseudovirgaria hyperparasitica]KAF2761214.1 hypothetical protein EJ05DRAFT_508400 [Pseudovirgaria hyperparasitica]
MARIPQRLLASIPSSSSSSSPSTLQQATARLPPSLAACTRCSTTTTTLPHGRRHLMTAKYPDSAPRKTDDDDDESVVATRWDGMEHMGSEKSVRRAGEPAVEFRRFISARGKAQSDRALTGVFEGVFKATDGSWRGVALDDLGVKFRAIKQIMQQTGRIIPDPIIHEVRTAGALFAHMRQQNTQTQTTKSTKTQNGTARVADVMRTRELAANVHVSSRRRTMQSRESAIGRWKVVQKALMERHLPLYRETHDWDAGRVRGRRGCV